MAANGTSDAKTSADGTAQASQGTSDDKSPSLEGLVPAISDAPKGQVTLSQNAGAFGPWRGHKIIDEIAKKIATATVEFLFKEEEPAQPVPAEAGRAAADPDGEGAPAEEAHAEEPAQPVPAEAGRAAADPDGEGAPAEEAHAEEPAQPVPAEAGRAAADPDGEGAPAEEAHAEEPAQPVPAEAGRAAADPDGEGAPAEEAHAEVRQAGDEPAVRTLALPARVLVVSDRLLLPGAWSARYVRSSLGRLEKRLALLSEKLETEKEPLDEAIESIRAAEPERPAVQRESAIGGPPRAGTDRAASAAASQPAASVPSVLSGALGDAVNLLGLLRTDYTITATTVTATPSELSTLTAAHLAEPKDLGKNKPRVRVTAEADAFSTVGPSPSADLLESVLGKRDDVVERISDLQAILAPVQAELTAINARATSLEQAWASLVTSKNGDPAIAQFQAALDGLAAQSARRQQATAEAAAAVAYAQQVVTDTDAALAALLQPSGSGEAPLLTAIRYEWLDQANEGKEDRKVTHVLYVNLDAVAADAVTRQSLLGTSDRISFLSSGNASWLLLNTTTGAIAGGQVSLADVMTFSLETRKTDYKTVAETEEKDLGKDPLKGLEFWAKAFVFVFGLVLAVLGVISFIAIFRIAFPG